MPDLTDRQVEVLAAYVVAGSYAAAGKRLGVSPHTVKNTLTAMRRRTGWTVEQAIYFGARKGWLVLRDSTA